MRTNRTTRAGRATTLTALTASAVLAFSGVAVADTIQDTINDDGTGVTLVASSGDSGSASIRLVGNNAQGDPDPGCNIDPGDNALSLNIRTPEGVTASPNPLNITSCGPEFAVSFTASATAVSGRATVAIISGPAGGGTYVNQVDIPITIANRKPSVAVKGVTNGAEYVEGSVPTATCDVTDVEQPNEADFAAALSGTLTNGLGTQTATCDFTDNGGLKADSKSVTYSIVAANTAPQVSVTGVTNGSTYEKSQVSPPGCSVVDAEDTDESAIPSITNGAFDALGSHTATCSYTDGGNVTRSASATYTVVRDKDTTAPIIGYTLNPAQPDGANGWYKGDVRLNWTVTEGESSETLTKTDCVDQSIIADQAATTYSCSATSEGGTDSKSVTIKRDGTGPVVSYDGVVSGTAGANGWYTSDVTVKFTATDALSGPASASQNVTASGDGNAVTVGSPAFSDAAGNTTAAGNKTSPAFKIDSQAPNAPTASLSPAPNTAGWNNSDVVVKFADNGDNGPSGVDTCTTAVTVNEDGEDQTVSGTCTDKAGNVSAVRRVTVDLDKTAPVITNTATVSGTQGTGDWYTSDVTVTFKATDNLSGFTGGLLNLHTFTKTTSGEGPGVTVSSGTVDDVAGNTSNSVTSSAFAIDKAAPTNVAFVDGPAAGSSSYFGSVPAEPTCTADDATSGLKDCAVTGYSTATGTHTMTATATDNAGHKTTATRTYTVLAWTTKGFYSPVDMGGVVNTAKVGSTIPLKFELFKGTTELTDVAAIKSFTHSTTTTSATAPADEIELLSSGSTSLRYDSTGGQFIQNWKTPTTAGSYKVTLTAQDGSTLVAYFNLRK